MRVSVAVLLVGLGVAGALWLSSYTVTERVQCVAAANKPVDLYARCFGSPRPGWVLPASVLIGFVGAALGAGVLVRSREAL